MQNENGTLRTVVGTIERQLSCLSAQPGSEGAATAGLVASWGDLVKLLALGPAPEFRECPECRNVGMRAATLCGYCWTPLTPVAPVASA